MAVKILKEERATPTVIDYNKQEAILLDKLDHHNIIKVRHLIKLNGTYYMGMELLSGSNLHGFLKNKFAKKEKFTDLEAS
jgi:serine/threonine protein kinase